jgi:hypothetical protein
MLRSVICRIEEQPLHLHRVFQQLVKARIAMQCNVLLLLTHLMIKPGAAYCTNGAMKHDIEWFSGLFRWRFRQVLHPKNIHN